MNILNFTLKTCAGLGLCAVMLLSPSKVFSQVTLINETFSGGTPAGWTATDITSSGTNWVFDNPGDRVINAGSTAFDTGFAIFDSDDFCHEDEEGTLESPAFDASLPGTYRLEFDNSFGVYSEDEDGLVEVWNGTAWVVVLTFNGAFGDDGYPDANHKVLNIGAATGGSSVAKVRFHYVNGNCDWYWAVDNVTVTRINCSAPAATYTVIPDCTNNQFSISVNLTSMGSATNVAITDGSTTYATATAPGVYLTGSFPSPSVHDLTLVHNINTLCNSTAPVGYNCTTPNDECSGAQSIVSSATCNLVSGTTLGATASAPAVLSSCLVNAAEGDVWYSFQANATTQAISLRNITAINNDAVSYLAGIAVYSGSCGSLSLLDCGIGGFADIQVDANITLIGATIGETYYVRVWADYAENQSEVMVSTDYTFDVCVMDLAPVTNDECNGALFIGGDPVSGHNFFATQSIAPGNCGDEVANDVWYYFTTASSGTVEISGNSSLDELVMEVLSGSCGSLVEEDCTAINLGGAISLSVNAGTTYYIRVYGYDEEEATFTLQLTGTPLPVLMSNLSGTLLAGNKAALSWNTFTEQNNKGFEIQRSKDGRDFKNIGFVGSKAKSGNSSQSIPYSFNDADAVQDVAYYRLRQTDLDGKTTYSNIARLAAGDASGFDVMVAPNPVKSNLVINTYGERSANATIYISDMTGKLIRTLPVTAAETQVDMSGLASGLYLVKYSDANYNRTIKVSKE